MPLPWWRACRPKTPSTQRSPRPSGDRLGEVGDDGLEADVGGGDGLAHLLHLPLVLDEAERGQEGGQRVVGLGQRRGVGALGGARGVELRGELAVGVAHDAHGHLAGVLGRGVGELVDVAGRQAELGLDVLDRGAGADPELAVAGVGEELVGVAAGERTEVEDRLVAAVLERLEHQHGVGLAVAAEPGQVGERAVRAEDVVRVVAAHLQATGGHDEPLALEGLADPRAALRGIPRSIGARRRAGAPRRPALGHKSAELVGGRPRAVVCLLLLFAAHPPMVARPVCRVVPGTAPLRRPGRTARGGTCGEATSSTRVRILRTRVDDPPEHSLPPGPVDRSGARPRFPGRIKG